MTPFTDQQLEIADRRRWQEERRVNIDQDAAAIWPGDRGAHEKLAALAGMRVAAEYLFGQAAGWQPTPLPPAELVELSERATGGKWDFAPAPNDRYITTIFSDTGVKFAFTDHGGRDQQNDDAELICAAVNFVRTLSPRKEGGTDACSLDP